MPIIASDIVTLAQAKDYLNITTTASDTKLPSFITSASQTIVNRIGVVAATAVNEWHDGGSDRIVLRNQGPIASVTTVTETIGTVAYTLTQVTLDSAPSGGAFTYSVDLNRGVLVRRAAGVAVPFASGVQNVHITFSAGFASVPADITEACLILIKERWQSQRGPKAQTEAENGDRLPDRVEEILANYGTSELGIA
jgi:uncharacterized phiE125 gp8 family phage protein